MEYGFLRQEDEIFPPIVHVENTNVCNLRCIHCPHHDILKIIPDYKPQSISMGLWREIVDEVSQYPAALRLTPDGEPMLPSEFAEQVRYAQDKGVNIFTLNANGMFLEGEKAEIMLRPGNTRIALEVSLDGFFRNTYERIRVKANYMKVMRNIMNFILERNRRKLDNVKVLVSIVQQPELPDGELELFDRFWSQIVDKVIIRNYVDTKGLTPKKMVDERVVERRWPCPVVFTRLVVTYDGTVRFCPDDWQKTTRLPSLHEAGSLRAIWQSKEYQQLRRNHLEGAFTHPTCAACTDWKVIRWGYDYISVLNQLFSSEHKKQAKDDNLKYLWDDERDGKVTREAISGGDR
jgi:radical SAM protein with 4Fe4S-binding SPASM domain